MTKHPESTPSDVCAEDGEVLMDGPGGLAMSLTPDAAVRTARALDHAAQEAMRQRAASNGSAAGEHEGGGADQT